MSKSIANGIVISAASLLLFEIVGIRSAPAQQTESKPPVAEGDWVRTDTNGSGSFDHLLSTYKQASLTPEGQAMMAAGGRGGRGGGRGGPGDPMATEPQAMLSLTWLASHMSPMHKPVNSEAHLNWASNTTRRVSISS
jgi:hypothetical protein